MPTNEQYSMPPAENATPLDTRLIVRRYEKPDKMRYGSLELHVPKEYRKDRSQSVWEVVSVGKRVDEASLGNCAVRTYHGLERDEPPWVREGDIVETQPWVQNDYGDDEHFYVFAKDIKIIHVWREEGDDRRSDAEGAGG